MINDHLGDAYWQVGRKREAMFQWAHARDLDPEGQELPKILDKIENGLMDEQSAADRPAAPNDSSQTMLGAVKPVDGAAAFSSVKIKNGDTLSTIAERVWGNPNLYLKIFDANKDRLVDPNIIYPGMTLTIPALETN